MEKNKDIKYLEKIEKIEYQPIFILGLHRSGTTILYKMLTATKCFNPVTAYHLIKYDQLLYDYVNKKQETTKRTLTDSFRKNGTDDRGIDKLKITADFAEEYGFFLDTKSCQMLITKKNLSIFNEMCKKIAYVTDIKKPILLKNPYDYPNFIFIKKMLPNAKFVFINRHPLKVLSSTMNALKVLFKDYNFYASKLSRIYNKIYENPLSLFCIRSLTSKLSCIGLMILVKYSSKSTKYYLKNLKNLPKDCYISITYEELCNKPQITVENIIKKLEIHPKGKIDFSEYIKPRKTVLFPTVKSLKKYIYKSMKPYFKTFNYKIDDY